MNEELNSATITGDVEKVKRLLATGENLNAKCLHDALILAVRRPSYSRWENRSVNGRTEQVHYQLGASEQQSCEIIKALLSAGVDLNTKWKYGATALDIAKYKESSGIARFLEEMGAKRGTIWSRIKMWIDPPFGF